MESEFTLAAGIFLSIAALCVYNHKVSNSPAKKSNKQPSPGDDSCSSLFYDKNIAPDGKGFPHVGSDKIDGSTMKRMCTTHPEYKRIPMEIYKEAVENMIICCVDIVCQRTSDKKLLLLSRRDPPAAKIWWWPGGRMFRGETFFDTAIRKIYDETGYRNRNPPMRIIPQGVIHVWNTFFPDSCFDEGRKAGHEGTQTVNAVVVCILEDKGIEAVAASADTQQANSLWAVEEHRWVSVEEASKEGNYDKYVRSNVLLASEQGLLL